MFQIIKPDTHVDFIRLRRLAFGLSTIVIVLGLITLVARGGPNYGIDFTGGLMLHIGVDPKVDISEIRSAVGKWDGGEVSVQRYGADAGEFLLRVPVADEKVGGGKAAELKTVLGETLGLDGLEILRTEIVGPRVGAELRQRGILSVLFATLMMGAYIAIRFDLRFGVGAAVALAHDVLVVVGAMALYDVEITLTVIAALLTVIGYSVNDTVVVSDRIRENLREFDKGDLAGLINASINETLSRTVLTTGTTLLVLFALLTVGGSVIHDFAFTLIVGLTAGTYSSIFIASPVVEYWNSRRGGEGQDPATAVRAAKASA